MQRIFTDPRIPGKTIVFDDSSKGKIKFTVNGIPCTKQKRNTYVYDENGTTKSIVVLYSMACGMSFTADGISFTVYPDAKWYDFVLSLVPLFTIYAVPMGLLGLKINDNFWADFLLSMFGIISYFACFNIGRNLKSLKQRTLLYIGVSVLTAIIGCLLCLIFPAVK